MKYNNETSTNTSESVKLFADYFSCVYEKSFLSSDVMLSTLSSNINHINLSSWSIGPDEIYDYLFSLDLHARIGPDGTPSVFLKQCCSVLLKPLYFIFDKSLNPSYFPDSWKKSFVTPIHMTGDNNITNYRPISKLLIILKIFEALITKKLSIIVSPFICNNQHGFRPKMSISTNILLYQSKILKALNDHVQIDSIYTDFQKAFDKIQYHFLRKYLHLEFMEIS
jgi:hypothetical protein